jgi:hypothetical protein
LLRLFTKEKGFIKVLGVWGYTVQEFI